MVVCVSWSTLRIEVVVCVSWSTLIIVVVVCFLVNTENCGGCLVFPGQHWELWWLSVSWSTLIIVVVVLCFLVNTDNCDGCLCFLVIDTTSKEVADTPILLGLYFTVISPKFHDDCRWVSGPHKHLSVKIYQTRAIFNRVTTCCWVHCNNAK